MARAAFNTTCDLVWGPGTATPGVVRVANVPCRYVPEDIELPTLERMAGRLAYVNMDAATPQLATIGGSIDAQTLDYDFADRIAIPSGVAPIYLALLNETLTPGVGTPYVRCHVENFTLRPLLDTCHACPKTATTWTISFPVGAWAFPFNGGPFTLVYRGGVGGECLWEFDIPFVQYALLEKYNPAAAFYFSADDYLGNSAKYTVIAVWKCMAENTIPLDTANIACPPYVVATPS